MPSSTHAGGNRTAKSGPQPNAAVRRCVAEAYRVAFNGSAALALTTLEQSSRARDPIDRVHLASAKTHLLYLDGRSDEALDVLEKSVLPLVDQFATDLRETIDFNRTIVANDCGDWLKPAEVDRHHALVDRRAAVGFESGEPSKLLSADRAAADGKLYDALPIYTSAFYNAFSNYDWSAWKESAARLSGAVLQFADVSQATFYAFVSEDDRAVETLALYLIARNDPTEIDKGLEMLKRKANLKRHRCMAFKLVAGLGQAVPDHAADDWSSLCRLYRQDSVDGWRTKPMFDVAWKVSSVVAAALSTAAADQLGEDALNHPNWRNAVYRQESFYPALSSAIPKFSDALAVRIVETVAPYARPPLEFDFQFATALLANLYDARPAQHDLVRRALVLSEEAPPAHLARMARHCSIEIPSADIEIYVQQANEFLESQIKGGSVTLGLDMNLFMLLDARKDDLRQEQVDGIVARMLDLIANPSNVNFNRAWMIQCVAGFMHMVGPQIGQRATRLFATYASDHRTEGHPLRGEPEEEHPMSSARMGSARGWPQDLRGQALAALGEAASRTDLVDDIDLDSLVRGALDDSNPRVRSLACAAVSRAEPKLCNLMRVVVVRAVDPATEVANIALRVLAHRKKDVADLSLGGSALAAASAQARHVDPVVRAAAAQVIASLGESMMLALTSEERRQREAVAKRLSVDVVRSVRQRLA